MKIAICDKSQEDIRQLKELIRQSKFCPDCTYFYDFLNGEDLLENYNGFDVIFLEMYICQRMDGILIAQNIRKRDTNVFIMFYSEFESPASRVSFLHPYNYLLKKYSTETLIRNIDLVLEEVLNKDDLPKIPFLCKGQLYVLQISDIVYIQIYKKGTQIWLSDKKRIEIGKETVETSKKIIEYYLMLNQFGFIHVGESYLINAEKVITRDKTSVYLHGGYNLPVARRKKKF